MINETSIYQEGMIPQGSRVVVVVSRGQQPNEVTQYVSVPTMVGKPQGGALEALGKQGLQAHVVYDYHPEARKGTVMAQLPAPETSVPFGSKVTVLVSSGPALSDRLAVEIPDVVGMDETRALTTLTQAGLSPQVRYEYSDTTPSGAVIEQLPDRDTFGAAAMARSTKRTALWVSLGIVAIAALLVVMYFLMNSMAQMKRTYLVPDVVGMSTAEATREIGKSGLSVGTIKEVTTTKAGVEDGEVLSTDPKANTEAEAGTSINLEVANVDDSTSQSGGTSSSTTSTKKNAVPNVVGMTQASATTRLTNAGFKVTAEKMSSDTVKAGVIISQTPRAGVMLPENGLIDIVVSTGPETTMVDVPDVVGLSESAARSTLVAAGLKMKKSEGSSTDVAQGNVISQVPEAGSSVKAGSSVTVVISTGPQEQ